MKSLITYKHTSEFIDALDNIKSANKPIVLYDKEDQTNKYVNPYKREPLNFTAIDVVSTVALASLGTATTVHMFKSFDNENWETWDKSAITLQPGETVYIYNDTGAFNTSGSNGHYFVMTGKIAAHGNVNSLLSLDGNHALTN